MFNRCNESPVLVMENHSDSSCATLLVQDSLRRNSDPLSPDSSPTDSEPLRLGAQHGMLPDAQLKRRRKGKKSMSRRTGQTGTIVIAGNWYRVRWYMDVEDQEKRVQMSEKVAPLVFDKNGMPKPPSSEVKLRAREIVEKSGANSEERFNRVVLGRVTFRTQAKAYLHWIQNRDRRRIKDPGSVEGALNKWILPAIGDLLLSDVHNLSVKPLVDKMKRSLSARTVNKYVQYIGQVVASLRDGRTGEPVHHRQWNSAVMDLPVVRVKNQRRPTLRLDAINKLVRESEGKEQALYVLLAATGLRISEALALETKHFINDGRTIQICQQVDRRKPRIVEYTKTDAGTREVDLSTDVARFMQSFMNGKDGLLFRSRKGTPHMHNGLERRWLTPRLQAMQLDEKGMGFHAFRRFRKTWLRGERCQEDINNFWMGHQPQTMSELYSRMEFETARRLKEAELVGVGFTVPSVNYSKSSKISGSQAVEVAA